MEDKKEFIDKIRNTKENEELEQLASDEEKAKGIFYGVQDIYLDGFGWLTFKFPDLGLAIQGDRIYAAFKAEHLRKQDIMTEAQLKAIYSRDMTIIMDGKEIVVDKGEWTHIDERRLEDLPTQIQEEIKIFNDYRDDIQNLETSDPQKKDDEILKQIEKKTDEAFQLFQEINKKKIELLELQTKRLRLFSASLEEQALMEKIKLFAPHCILVKDTGKPLWANQEEMMKAGYQGIQVLSIFNLFLRGGDVSFFGDMPDKLKTS